MRQVKQTGDASDSQMFRNDAAILKGHLPTAEFGKFSIEVSVDLIKGCSLH